MSTALYRRYRPETFADVIGQEHVTDPLMAALRSDRITHAYLFSGPRGCGKTTSARIFARCLNCEQGPTDTPCGTCPSCVDLARGGAGSLDVVEMDAASHGGVDDARELRERAAFAPARDRYKIFVIDEAHMVTNQGFNALLKLVEEPPAHVKFVFATTEPEKVIGTIRSRTHHYPFRLVPPDRLLDYLERLSSAEQVSVEAGVLPLVVRAGGGSVRDSLSVLDQLIAGARDGAIDYERAVALLGYTHATLLDDVVDAIAAADGAALFRVVDRVIDSGHDPRRFAEDLLERLRDLVVIAVSGEHAATALRSIPQDQFDRMRLQAQQLGPAQLSRSGDLVNDALTEMSGATSPRLQLELLCARLLLPAAGDAARGFGARLERIERHLAAGGGPAPAAPTAPAGAAAPAGPTEPAAPTSPAAPAGGSAAPATEPGPSQQDSAAAPGRAAPEATSETDEPPQGGAPAARDDHRGTTATQQPDAPEPAGQDEREARRSPGDQSADPQPAAPQPVDRPSPPPAAEPVTPQPAASSPDASPPATAGPPAHQQPGGTPSHQPAAPEGTAPGTPGAVDAEMVRRRWPEVLATLARFRRTTWALVSQDAQVADVSGGVLHLAFSTSGLAHTFRSGQHVEPLQRALNETLGLDVRIEPVLSTAAKGAAGDGPGSADTAWGPPSAGAVSSAPVDAAAAWGAASPAAGAAGPAGAASPAAGAPPGAPHPAASPANGQGAESPDSPAEPPGSVGTSAAAAPGHGGTTPAGAVPGAVSAAASPSAPSPAPAPQVAPADDTASMDDPDAENSDLSGARLVEQLLGGTIIEEIED